MGAIYGYPQLGSGKNRTVPEAPMNKLHWGLSMRSFRFSKCPCRHGFSCGCE